MGIGIARAPRPAAATLPRPHILQHPELSADWHRSTTQRRRIGLTLAVLLVCGVFSLLVLGFELVSVVGLLTWLAIIAIAIRPFVGLCVAFGLCLLFEAGGADAMQTPGTYLHGGLGSTLLRLPVYGPGPFPPLGRFDTGFVTLVNPCLEKGVDVFLELARLGRDLEFAAVPAWGTGADVRWALEREPNVRVLEPVDDIEQVLAHTRVLLVPSLWPETFGYVVPEALLRGIPVLASEIGGLPEAGLGAATLLPVHPLARRNGGYVAARQDVGPWNDALRALLTDRAEYERRARQGRAAAGQFVAGLDPDACETLLAGLGAEGP